MSRVMRKSPTTLDRCRTGTGQAGQEWSWLNHSAVILIGTVNFSGRCGMSWVYGGKLVLLIASKAALRSKGFCEPPTIVMSYGAPPLGGTLNEIVTVPSRRNRLISAEIWILLWISVRAPVP